MGFALIIIFTKWVYEVLRIFSRIIKLSQKPKIHYYIKGSWEDFGDDPFVGFTEIKEVKINDAVCYLKQLIFTYGHIYNTIFFVA